MELWIRSQDREYLMKINRIDYDYSLGEHEILVNGYQTLVGKYKSKERALEVLDEIQSILLPNIKLITRNYSDEELKECSIKDLVIPPIEDVKIQELSTYVYEMPKD